MRRSIISALASIALSHAAFAQQLPAPTPANEIAVYQQLYSEAINRLIVADAQLIGLSAELAAAKAVAEKTIAPAAPSSPTEH